MNISTYTNTSAVPTNVFDLKHDDFYNFVEYQCGIIQAKILKFQLISDVDTFMECDDPTRILEYNNEKLKELKAESCLLIDDQSCIILPGIVASFSSLKKRLLKRNEQDIKEMKKNTNIQSTSTPLVATTTSQTKTIDELRSHIKKSIEQWINRSRQDLDLQSDSSLVESIDYSIEFKDNAIGQQSAIITCSCGSKSSLNRSGNTTFFQVSR
jgi:hypothetical protein